MPPRAYDLPADGTIPDDMRPESSRRPRSGPIDRQIAERAARQHGIVAIGQLRDLGIDDRGVNRRVETGRLCRTHVGVYAVGHPPLTRDATFMAAVLACGQEAVISHRSAAELWEIRERHRGPIDVTAARRRGRTPSGIAAHRDGSLTAVDRATVRGIPCTSVPRTLLDLAGVVSVPELRRAISEAEVLRILDHSAVRRLIKRSRGRRGVARLRMLLDDIHPATKRTRSEMERRFLKMCERAGLPAPEVNVPLDVGGRPLKPDFLWRDAGLIVEADSRRYHDTGSAFQRDRRREQRLQLAGWRVSHCTWEQVDREPQSLAMTIRGLLALATPPPTGRFRTHIVRNRPVGGG